MLIRTFAAVALATLAAATAQAGTIQNGTWTPSSACADPGDAPHFSSKSPDAFNKSQKLVPEWQGKAQAYVNCLNGEAKADQQAIITFANAAVGRINDAVNAMGDEQKAAVEKLKKQGATQH